MITGDLKPLAEIAASVSEFRHVLVMGCGSCVTVCLSGGDREARALADELAHTRHYVYDPPTFQTVTLERQCEQDLVRTFLILPPKTDAILSLACGAGVQTLAEVFDPLPVIPALNTTFLGAADAPGVWNEKCRGCGNCLLAYTGGICPIARCAKRLYNGPCGGSQGGHCEVSDKIPCAWAMIFLRLKRQNKLHLLSEVMQPRDWRSAQGVGPRQRKRTGIGGSPGDE
ncbi:MAG: methylenetetrahydrofolate reductase C-terminal domain-containing protein [Deltaproteobacteria bacterium]|nr:methylenetetrahydrofolate reductase C-terminal domain-containing protein [Deltaproteobacteria bacterium]